MAKDKAPEETKAPESVFQVLGNVSYSRDGVEKVWQDGEYVSLTPAEFEALPAALQSHLRPLAEVKIRKG